MNPKHIGSSFDDFQRIDELFNALAEALNLMDDMVFELPISTGRKFANRMTAIRKVLDR